VPRSDRSPGRRPSADDVLSELTGVRSGKNSYYRELRRTEERMTSAVRALEGISSALVRTRDDPRTLLQEVLRAAAAHLASDWTMITLRPGALPGLDDRFLALGPGGRMIASDVSLPAPLRAELTRTGHDVKSTPVADDGWVRVPMTLDGQILGQLIGTHPWGGTLEHEDLWVLRILVNQAALAMHMATMYSEAADLRTRAQDLYDEITRSSHDLQARTEELARAEARLRILHERELLDAERHRIALELHDSVAQYVLSAGLAVDLCRSDALAHGHDAAVVERLVGARDLIATAGDQVRSAIYALHHEPGGGETATLPQLVEGLAAQHRRDVDVGVRVEGRPATLPPDAERALARIVGEGLFNVVSHAKAGRVDIRLRYSVSGVAVSVDDDGVGDPRELRRLLRLEQRGDSDGRHQGLAGMSSRARGIGADFTIRRSSLGGIRLGVALSARRTGSEEN
jgi:signal transduction histidine kinase